MSTEITEEDKDNFYRDYINVTDEQIEEADNCKQREPKW